jgi:hypothetical protein
MVNEKETRALEGLHRPSQMCELGCMKRRIRTSKNLNSLHYFFMAKENRGAAQKLRKTPAKLSARLCLKRHRLTGAWTCERSSQRAITGNIERTVF